MHEAKQGARRQVGLLVLIVFGMFGFGFALVPLYDVFCEITGLNGKTSSQAAEAFSGQIDQSRWVNVEFISHVNAGMPWEFEPVTRRIKLHPGQEQVIYYRATNLSGNDMVGQAVPSVSPGLAAKHLNKIDCFCFNNQPLAAGESIDMPVRFFVDRELPANIGTLTLSYTLYNVSEPSATSDKSSAPSNKSSAPSDKSSAPKDKRA